MWTSVIPGVRARYWNAGHLLGSASIEIEFDGAGTDGQPLRLLSSGDVGPDAKLLQPDPTAPAGFDYVISESTYGDRIRAATTPEQRRQRLASEVRDAAAAKGALLIPAFAVERTQELIVDLVDLMERRDIPAAPIFLIRRWLYTPPGIPEMRQASTSTSTSTACSTRPISASPRPSTKARRSPS